MFRSVVFSKIILSIFMLNVLQACGPSDSSSSGSDDNVDADISVSVQVDSHDQNTLMAVISASDSSPFKIHATYSSSNTVELSRSTASFEASSTLTLIGLRAETIYDIQLTFEFENAEEQTTTLEFTSGSLPLGAPVTNIISDSTLALEGVTLFKAGIGANGDDGTPSYWGVDNEGFVVWYLHHTDISANTGVIRYISDGEFYVFDSDGLVRINSEGSILQAINLGAASNFHHDAIVLPNGHGVALTQEAMTIDGNALVGDQLVEVDAEGNTVWSWSSFDYLDSTRFPGPLSEAATRSGGLDWTHANSVFYDESDDSFIVSLRSQSWVIKIDHQTGDLKWIMGSSEEIEDSFDGPFISLTTGTWMANQHAATVTQNQQILIYDNANESDGEINNSRAVIYALDDDLMTADQVWEYRASKYTSSLGDADELSNGNILLCAGGPGSNNRARIIEATSTDSADTAWELEIEDQVYRAEKISWENFLEND